MCWPCHVLITCPRTGSPSCPHKRVPRAYELHSPQITHSLCTEGPWRAQQPHSPSPVPARTAAAAEAPLTSLAPSLTDACDSAAPRRTRGERAEAQWSGGFAVHGCGGGGGRRGESGSFCSPTMTASWAGTLNTDILHHHLDLEDWPESAHNKPFSGPLCKTPNGTCSGEDASLLGLAQSILWSVVNPLFWALTPLCGSARWTGMEQDVQSTCSKRWEGACMRVRRRQGQEVGGKGLRQSTEHSQGTALWEEPSSSSPNKAPNTLVYIPLPFTPSFQFTATLPKSE